MRPVATIKLNHDDMMVVKSIIKNERIIKDWDDAGRVSNEQLHSGLIGEIAAVRWLEGKHPNKIVVPMGSVSRINLSNGYDSGDILTIGNERGGLREVDTYEVKSTGSVRNKTPLVRCDQVEHYLDRGVAAIILVHVERQCVNVVARIMAVASPERIIGTWPHVKNKHGIECYRCPNG